MKKIYSFVMALCVVLCANATPLQGLKKGYQLLPSVAELATGMKKAPAATQGLQYDATEGELIRYYNETDAMEVNTDYLANGQLYIDILASDYSDYLSLLLFVEGLEDGKIPAGTYPINNTKAEGTAYASQGYSQQSGVIPCAYFPLVTQNGELYIYTPMYFMVSGNVVVEYVNDNLKLTINAVNSNNVPITIVYEVGGKSGKVLQYDEQTGSVERTYDATDSLIVTTDHVAQYGQLYVDIIAADSSDGLSLMFFTQTTDPEIGLPAGTYPISSTPAYGVARASEGYDAQYGPTPCVYFTLVEEGGKLAFNELYFLVKGQIVVEKVNGKMKLTIDALNSYGVSVKIIYEDSKKTLTVLSNDNAMGSVSGSGTYKQGQSVTIKATANNGYHFSHWNDGNTDNPRVVQVTEDQTYTAYFAEDLYTVTVVANNSEAGFTQGSGTYKYGTYTEIAATPNNGYHFSHWNDGNTDNPRVIQVTEEKTYTAYFEKNTYSITKQYDAQQGTISGPASGQYLENITLTAEPNYGYHFVRWNDGNTDNPRTLELTQDTILTAEFAANKYLISTVSNDPKRGTTSGDTLAAYLDYVTISATAKYGYHFSSWENGNADNPRLVQVTGDKEYMAYFDKNTYTVTTSCDGSYGTVSPSVTGEYLDTVTLTATPTLGYHFSRWSDGNTDNPRSFVLTQDTTFSAKFTQSFSGQCGDDLYWAYNESDQSIAITGTGDMYNYTSGTQPWVLFLEKIKKVTTDNTAASLGTSAFEGAIRLAEVHIGAKIDMIEANVFAGCDRLRNIYCYPTYPPIIRESSFARYDALLYIPCDYLDDYVFDRNWKKFENIQCAGAEEEEVESDEVEVDPSSTSVTMTWPTEENAYTYTIEIHKDGALFCRLVFNTEGQLLNLSFAPGRDGNNRPALYAEQVANGSGLRFTVTGLNESTHYTYDLRAKDQDENTLQSHSGEFTTKSDVTTDLENTDIQYPITNIRKEIRNGQLIILRDGVEYNAMGQEL